MQIVNNWVFMHEHHDVHADNIQACLIVLQLLSNTLLNDIWEFSKFLTLVHKYLYEQMAVSQSELKQTTPGN